MRRLFLALTACVAVWPVGIAAAFPLTATFTGSLYGTNTPFTAVFSYDTNDFVPVPNSNTFDGKGTATFMSPGINLTFDDSGYFYQTVSSGFGPLYEFGIGGSQGFLYLKYSGDVAEGNYQVGSDLASYTNLDPDKVTITGAVSPVPLPSAAWLFGGAIAVLGMAGHKKRHRKMAFDASPV
ncbi:VPLPA-CTERM sorting domain-containing protein [Lichenifustis flavocetrariae]|uniref:VPLPA-CTERM sorting domain-containing protein n=1 Tax=Lichenifustis flavocetrariae TaxID=2949735 RepID=A0AA42CHF5_9HYPH|nr:VPLPA-CTERM sorting domain-containing protein [Lichenifustis flavocetrariae]MCW6507219.1 VPLPA-CTERM sorting domain-containing protein [Lichenifustis flavocetrariae]